MVTINQEICIGCGKCAADCLGDYIKLVDNKAVMEEACLQCGHCVAVCPVKAVSIPQYDMADVEECDARDIHIDAEILLRAIKFRRSIRNYKPVAVEPEKLKRLVQAGRYTATAKNSQDCCFVIVQNEMDRLKELVWEDVDSLVSVPYKEMAKELLPFAAFNKRRKSNPADDYLFRNAPVVMYIVSERGWDAGMAAQNIEMMAAAQGMGVLYNGFLARISDQNQQLKKWLGLEERTIAACLLLGYPDVTYRRTAPRRKAEAVWR